MSSFIRYILVFHILIVSFSCTSERKKYTWDLAVLSGVFKYPNHLIDEAIYIVRDRPGPKDCAEVIEVGATTSGIYRIWPSNWRNAGSLQVYCDMATDGGGWTIIQRRGQYGNRYDYFHKKWSEYKMGFGSLDKEFWLGNDIIFAVTNQGNYSLRVDMKDNEGNPRYATFSEFWIENEDRLFKLHVSGYGGNAGDSITDMDKSPFSTKDKDNDKYVGNCAMTFRGGWWYDGCNSSNPNAISLYDGIHGKSIQYYAWKKYQYSLTEVEMKIRPNSYAG